MNALLFLSLWPFAQELPDDQIVARAQGPTGEIQISAARLRSYALQHPQESPRKLAQDLLDFELLAAEAKQSLKEEKELLWIESLPILARLYLKKFFELHWNKAAISQEDLRKSYQHNIRLFRHPDLRKADHFLITLDDKFPPDHLEEKAEALAKEIRAALLAAPPKDAAEFLERAAEFRERVAATGLTLKVQPLGYFSRKGNYVEPFKEACFTITTPGQLSPVFSTRFGFHVARVDVVKPAIDRKFEEVEAELRDKLLPGVRTRELHKLLTQLSELHTWSNEAPLEALELRRGTEAIHNEP